MTREEILEAIKDLAKSQGYYDRLLRAIEEVRYVTFETLQNYITDSISNIEYDRTRFTNFLWLGNQAMLSLKRRGV